MMYKLICLTLALLTSNSDSQTLTVASPCIEAGQPVTLRCETTDFSISILFYLNGNSKGGCSVGTCLTGIAGYESPTQSGTSTEMTITTYDHSRDGGNWTCSYGAKPSNAYTVELGKCDSNTDSPTLSVAPPCIEAGQSVTLRCETTDFSSIILFYLNGNSKGGCVSGICMAGIAGYGSPTQSGTSTEITIIAYNHSRDGGSWTCLYGINPSNAYTVELGKCD